MLFGCSVGSVGRVSVASLIILGLSCTALLNAESNMEPRDGTLPNLKVPPVEWLAPDEALKTISTHPDFRVELIAHEPDIIAPVSAMFDENGRMWVVEMQAYMPNVDGDGEGEPISRIVVFEDTNRDGTYNKRTVFLDGLSLPRSVTRVHDGIVLGEGRRLWWCQDADGDLVCDDRREIGEWAKHGNVEHSENDLTWCIDNWYYPADSRRRFRFHNGEVIVETMHTQADTGQWGISQDNYGRRYWTTNNQFIAGMDSFSYHYGRRDNYRSGLEELYDPKVGNEVKTNRPNPGCNRAYQKSALDEDGRLRGGTSVAGGAIYRGGGGWPDSYIGHWFVTAPCGNVATLMDLRLEGFALRGESVRVKSKIYDEHEFIASTDELFRPVDVTQGPDGCMYLIDMRCPILQHKTYLSDYLRKQIITRGLNVTNQHGRIYRIVHRNGEVDVNHPRLGDADTRTLVECLSHPNGFWRDTAQRLIVERQLKDAVPRLTRLAASRGEVLPRIHALWALHGLDAIDRSAVKAALDSDDAQLQIAALRTGEELLAQDAGMRRQVIALLKSDNAELRVQAILSLGFAIEHQEVRQAMFEIASGDRETDLARFNSLGEAGPAALAEVMKQADRLPDAARLVRGLAQQVTYRKDDEGLRSVVAAAVGSTDPGLRHAAVIGVATGLRAFMSNKNKKMSPGSKPLATVDGFDELWIDPSLEDALRDIAIYAHWDQHEVDMTTLSKVYEVENARLVKVKLIDGKKASGGKYADFPNDGGSITWTVPVAVAGMHGLSFAYAIGRGDRPLRLLVDGELRQEVAFNSTGKWDVFTESAVTWVDLAAGDRSITLDATGLTGGNFDYLRVIEPAGGASEPAPISEALRARMAVGEKLFLQKACAGCHGLDGAGSAAAPSLMASDLVAADASVSIRVVLHGLTGERVVDGKTYRDLMMPPAAALLSDQELADVLTWVRVTSSDDGNMAVTSEEVKAVRAAHAKRTALWTVEELRP